MRALIHLMLVLLPSVVWAGETPWQEVAPDVKLRIITSDQRAADGTSLAALEIDMPPGTRTYWRVPGQSGIPTEIDLAGSAGLKMQEMLWPYPTLESARGVVDFVYAGDTVLPFRMSVADANTARLDAEIWMGICSDICVPVSARFTVPLDFTAPDPGQALRIAQAVSNVPIAWPERDSPFAELRFDTAQGGLAIAPASPEIDPQSLIADMGPAGQLFGAPQKSRDGNLVVLPALGGVGEAGLEGQPVTLTFMTLSGPYAVTARIESGASAQR